MQFLAKYARENPDIKSEKGMARLPKLAFEAFLEQVKALSPLLSPCLSDWMHHTVTEWPQHFFPYRSVFLMMHNTT